MTKSRNNVIISVCRKTSIVDKKGVAGAKPPTGTRGGSPSKIAPFRGKGFGVLIGIENLLYFYKKRLFLQAEIM